MSDTTLKEDDDELVIVETDKLPEPGSEPKTVEPEDDDDEDARLSEDLDDDDDDQPIVGDGDEANKNRKKRKKRREAQKAAQERATRELTLLREQNDLMSRRLAAMEGRALTTDEATVKQRLQEAKREAEQAETIMARAIEASNGDDAAAALRLRDAARDRVVQLEATDRQLQEAKKRPAEIDPRVKSYATEWVAANPWYRADGSNDESAITNAIDKRLVAEGYDAKSVDYWEELTKRVSARFGGADDKPKKKGVETEDTPPKKKAPPMGGSRENVPASTRKEVYVTPERKQAMIDAGAWEDPVKRARMLKAYQAYDRNSAR